MNNKFKPIYLLCFIIYINSVNTQLQEKRLCVDSKCKEPISAAKTLLRYTSPHPSLLSFPPNEVVTVFSKPLNSKAQEDDLWEVEIRKKRGFIRRSFIREYKVFRASTELVTVEVAGTTNFLNFSTNETKVPSQEASATTVQPSKVLEPHEVIDGTTILLDPENSFDQATPSSDSLDNSNVKVDTNNSSSESVIQPSQESIITNANTAENTKIYKEPSDSEKSLDNNIAESKPSVTLNTAENIKNIHEPEDSNNKADGDSKKEVEHLSQVSQAQDADLSAIKKDIEENFKTYNSVLSPAPDIKENNDRSLEKEITSDDSPSNSQERDSNNFEKPPKENSAEVNGNFPDSPTESNQVNSEELNKKLDPEKHDQEEVVEENKKDESILGYISSFSNWMSDDKGEQENKKSENEGDEEDHEEEDEEEDGDDDDDGDDDGDDEDEAVVSEDNGNSSSEILLESLTTNPESSTNYSFTDGKKIETPITPNTSSDTASITKDFSENNNTVETPHIPETSSATAATVKESLDGSNKIETPVTPETSPETASNTESFDSSKKTETPLAPETTSETATNMKESIDSSNKMETPLVPETSSETIKINDVNENMERSQDETEKTEKKETNTGFDNRNYEPALNIEPKISPEDSLKTPQSHERLENNNPSTTTTEPPFEMPNPMNIPIDPVTRPPVFSQPDVVTPNPLDSSEASFVSPNKAKDLSPEDTMIKVDGSKVAEAVTENSKTETPTENNINTTQDQGTNINENMAVPIEMDTAAVTNYDSILSKNTPPQPEMNEPFNETTSDEIKFEETVPTVQHIADAVLSESVVSEREQVAENYKISDEATSKNLVSAETSHETSAENLSEIQYNSDLDPNLGKNSEAHTDILTGDVKIPAQEETPFIQDDPLVAPGVLDNVYSYFGNSGRGAPSGEDQKNANENENLADEDAYKTSRKPLADESEIEEEHSFFSRASEHHGDSCHADPSLEHCDAELSRNKMSQETPETIPGNMYADLFEFNLAMFSSDLFLYLVTTAVSVLCFLFGYLILEKNKREGPLVAKVNQLEKELLVSSKEIQIMQEKIDGTSIDNLINTVPNDVVEELRQELFQEKRAKSALEEQIQSLEKELENSTEVSIELNKMLSDILNSQNGSESLMSNIEQLQRQLVEQQSTINSINESLSIKDTENHELHLELEIANKKVIELQTEIDKLLSNMLKLEEEKDLQQSALEAQIEMYKQKYEKTNADLTITTEKYSQDIQSLQLQLNECQHNLELKSKEYDVLKENVKAVKSAKNNSEVLKALIDSSSLKAELEQTKEDNKRYLQKLEYDKASKYAFEKKYQSTLAEINLFREKYEEIEKEKLEAQTKLEVLSNYFKEKEAEMQREINRHESLWNEKQGETTSTIERIKYMQEELQNYKSQNEALKQEILNQEVALKSQISLLEKKVNDNWVMTRQSERRLEDAKHEAAVLRNRLTMQERAIHEEKNRMQSPIEQNGELPMSPLPHLESPASPAMLFGSRDHMTKSPPIPPPGMPPFLPPPFLPPPLGPGMPPPLGPVMPPPGGLPPPPFMPPPLFPGDHRPPPLGRMSSPPPGLGSRYSPDSRPYSPYDRHSPSPPYDSEYGASPPPIRGYPSYTSGKKHPPQRSNGRNNQGSNLSSGGSGQSNESIDRINQRHSKV